MDDIWDQVADLISNVDQSQLELTVSIFGVILAMNFAINVIGLYNCVSIFVHLVFLVLSLMVVSLWVKTPAK
jgi:hypothetical protein